MNDNPVKLDRSLGVCITEVTSHCQISRKRAGCLQNPAPFSGPEILAPVPDNSITQTSLSQIHNVYVVFHTTKIKLKKTCPPSSSPSKQPSHNSKTSASSPSSIYTRLPHHTTMEPMPQFRTNPKCHLHAVRVLCYPPPAHSIIFDVQSREVDCCSSDIVGQRR